MLTLANESGETTSYAYDAAGRLSTTTLANGQVSTLGYDARSRQTSVYHRATSSSSSNLISWETDAYDDAGNLSSKTVDATTTTYGYDAADQLTSEVRPGYSLAYSYDANGNRASKTIGSVAGTYVVDDGDKLTSITENGATLKSYGYDAAGRTTSVVSSAGTTTLAYDYEGRVTSISGPSVSDSFTYNGLDTRVGKVEASGAKTFRRDGADVTAPVLTDGAATYTPGISQRRGGATTYDLHDQLGTAARQTDATASLTATRTYDAFGGLLASTGSPQGPFGFGGSSGYQEDADTGLKLLGHRYYDQSTGRFLTRDPAMDGRNWYTYCGNDPLRNLDPSGLSFWGWGDDQWVGFSRWFNGRDDVDNNGNPVHIGGLPGLLNRSGNIMTYDGTMHARDEQTFQDYIGDPHWQNHEEGHINDGFSKADLPVYALDCVVGFFCEILSPTGKPSTGGPTGHDYMLEEEKAETYAYNKDGIWDFGSPFASPHRTSH